MAQGGGGKKQPHDRREQDKQEERHSLTRKVQRRQVLAAPFRRQRLQAHIRHALLKSCDVRPFLIPPRDVGGGRIVGGHMNKNGENREIHKQERVTSGFCRTQPPPALANPRPSRRPAALPCDPPLSVKNKREITRD